MTNKAREKARALRYKRAMLGELNIDSIRDILAEISEECYNVRYYADDDEALTEALDGDEEEAYEFKLMFSELSSECDMLYELLDEMYIPESFDDFFIGIMAGRESPFPIFGYDTVELDYYLLNSYDAKLAERESYKKLMRLTKDELIQTAGECFGIAMAFLSVQRRYDYLKAAFDILLDENSSFLQTIKDIDAAYADADRDGWDSEATRRFEKLTQTLPDKTWLE